MDSIEKYSIENRQKRKRKPKGHADCTDDGDPASLSTRPTKRKRTTFTSHQVSELNKHFKEDNYPDSMKQREIADFLELNELNIYNWFQNKRAKERKQAGNASPLVSLPLCNATPPTAESSTKVEVHLYPNSGPHDPYTPVAGPPPPAPSQPLPPRYYSGFFYTSNNPSTPLPGMQPAYPAVYSPSPALNYNNVPPTTSRSGCQFPQPAPPAAQFYQSPQHHPPPHGVVTWPSPPSMPPPPPATTQRHHCPTQGGLHHMPPVPPSNLFMVVSTPSTSANSGYDYTRQPPVVNADPFPDLMKLPCFNENEVAPVPLFPPHSTN